MDRTVRPARSFSSFAVGASPALRPSWDPPGTPPRPATPLADTTNTPTRPPRKHAALPTDDTMPSYESLEHLLASKGFSHTRVVTPEASQHPSNDATTAVEDSPDYKCATPARAVTKKRSIFHNIVNIFHSEETIPPLPQISDSKPSLENPIIDDLSLDDVSSDRSLSPSLYRSYFRNQRINSSSTSRNHMNASGSSASASSGTSTSTSRAYDLPSPRLLGRPSMPTIETSDVCVRAGTVPPPQDSCDSTSLATTSCRSSAMQSSTNSRQLHKASSAVSLSRAMRHENEQGRPLTPPPPLPALVYPATAYSPPPTPSHEESSIFPQISEEAVTESVLVHQFPSPERPNKNMDFDSFPESKTPKSRASNVKDRLSGLLERGKSPKKPRLKAKASRLFS